MNGRGGCKTHKEKGRVKVQRERGTSREKKNQRVG